MKYKDLEKYFLCGIGACGEIIDFRVGAYDKERETFSFNNGSYSAIELGKEPRGNNATYVISATSLQEIDDGGLLYKYKGNV